MKQMLKSLRLRILLPVIVIALFVIILLTTMFSRAYISMILQQENEVNTVGFETVTQAISPLINASVSEVRKITANDRVASYIRLKYASVKDLIHARIKCRDYLISEIARHEAIYGLLFMRENGSLFGVLPDGNFFRDDPEANPLPEDIKAQIMNAPLGQTVWVGPLPASVIYGYENDHNRQNVIIGVSKSTNVSYGECYSLLVMSGSVFADQFTVLQDGKSSWHIFTENRTEIFHTGHGESCHDPDLLISNSNSGALLRDENGTAFCTFSRTMDSPSWTLVREVSMENYEQVVSRVRNTVWILAGAVLLLALVFYTLWLKKFMRQFNSLQNGIVSMGQGNLDKIEFVPTSISEFETMQQEITRTCEALNRQMDTIRRMEREQAEQENKKKEQERIERELVMAREIQANALPNAFPAFPDRTEFSLYASMTPAKEVGGDFYDFFLVDSDHLALVIADVSGKGVPAALFMMVSKTLLKNELMSGYDPATAMERVNLQLYERNSTMMFVTVWIAVVEISTGKGLACNAGHEHPALLRAGGTYELIKYTHSGFIGVNKKARYQNREFVLHPGDCLFVYTDGVPEALNGSEEMFGENRLEEALNVCPESSPEETLQRVKNAVNSFVGDAEQFDDLTMMCLKYKGPSL
jgi:sigma-B regulation protein RsbU (phosphoserine phosphatase)